MFAVTLETTFSQTRCSLFFHERGLSNFMATSPAISRTSIILKPSTIPAFPGMLVRSDGGYTLRECHADIGPPKHASALTTAFNELTALRILTWKCQGYFLNVANPYFLHGHLYVSGYQQALIGSPNKCIVLLCTDTDCNV
jgi:hypothetical protein